jgi:benzoyl-CoA reductase/2-hydroxyglutaryl-CoA dehydratase subunit BcrC/BadD/HgdB
LLSIFDELKLQIAADDVAAESRQYRTDANTGGAPIDELADKFARMDNCSVLYDPDKKRADLIVSTAKSRGAKGVVVVLTKFCDPEEFDYVIIKKACDAAGLPVLLIEVDRQMVNYAQAKTALETFKEVLVSK